jgi:hypothetical protein
VVVEMGLTVTTVPLVAGRFPGVITPVPLAKTAVRVEVPPAVMAVGFTTKLAIVGAGSFGVLPPPLPPHATNIPIRRTATLKKNVSRITRNPFDSAQCLSI